MIKQLAWNTFKNTGNIDTFMELVAVRNIENSLGKNLNCCLENVDNSSEIITDTVGDSIIEANENLKVNEYGDNKNQGIDNI